MLFAGVVATLCAAIVLAYLTVRRQIDVLAGVPLDDPQRLAGFWALALGYVKESGFDEPDNASIVNSIPTSSTTARWGKRWPSTPSFTRMASA